LCPRAALSLADDAEPLFGSHSPEPPAVGAARRRATAPHPTRPRAHGPKPGRQASTPPHPPGQQRPAAGRRRPPGRPDRRLAAPPLLRSPQPRPWASSRSLLREKNPLGSRVFGLRINPKLKTLGRPVARCCETCPIRAAVQHRAHWVLFLDGPPVQARRAGTAGVRRSSGDSGLREGR
jgi:hypothetical protein